MLTTGVSYVFPEGQRISHSVESGPHAMDVQ